MHHPYQIYQRYLEDKMLSLHQPVQILSRMVYTKLQRLHQRRQKIYQHCIVYKHRQMTLLQSTTIYHCHNSYSWTLYRCLFPWNMSPFYTLCTLLYPIFPLLLRYHCIDLRHIVCILLSFLVGLHHRKFLDGILGNDFYVLLRLDLFDYWCKILLGNSYMNLRHDRR